MVEADKLLLIKLLLNLDVDTLKPGTLSSDVVEVKIVQLEADRVAALALSFKLQLKSFLLRATKEVPQC